MKILSSLFALPFLVSPILAQTADLKVVSAGGGFEVVGNFSFSFTTGEAITATGTLPSGFILTQGFQQPEKIMQIGTKSPLPDGWDLKIYPNPANDELNIELKSEHINSASISIWDVSGRLVVSPQNILANTTATLSISLLSSGAYLVHLEDENGQTHTLGLVKAAR
jgi:hypothetical protein